MNKIYILLIYTIYFILSIYVFIFGRVTAPARRRAPGGRAGGARAYKYIYKCIYIYILYFIQVQLACTKCVRYKCHSSAHARGAPQSDKEAKAKFPNRAHSIHFGDT